MYSRKSSVLSRKSMRSLVAAILIAGLLSCSRKITYTPPQTVGIDTVKVFIVHGTPITNSGNISIGVGTMQNAVSGIIVLDSLPISHQVNEGYEGTLEIKPGQGTVLAPTNPKGISIAEGTPITFGGTLSITEPINPAPNLSIGMESLNKVVYADYSLPIGKSKRWYKKHNRRHHEKKK
ncbi:MAG: hypothetical protein ABUL44_01925 [Flavobacterium sp.]